MVNCMKSEPVVIAKKRSYMNGRTHMGQKERFYNRNGWGIEVLEELRDNG